MLNTVVFAVNLHFLVDNMLFTCTLVHALASVRAYSQEVAKGAVEVTYFGFFSQCRVRRTFYSIVGLATKSILTATVNITVQSRQTQ